MMKTSPLVLPLYKADDVALVGGKAINLYELLQAKMPVPDGFVITTAAFRSAGQTHSMPKDVAEQFSWPTWTWANLL